MQTLRLVRPIYSRLNPFTTADTWPHVPATVTKRCDNTSVGVIITDTHDRYLLFTRVTPPVGVAPAAGHIDTHGTAEQAAREEVNEELGLTVTTLTPLLTCWRSNVCRRQHGPHGPGHQWTVYHATVTGTLHTSPDEATDARWHTRRSLQQLANRTLDHATGRLTADQFRTHPGLEPVWADFLYQTGLIHLGDDRLTAIDHLTHQSPYPQEGGN